MIIIQFDQFYPFVGCLRAGMGTKTIDKENLVHLEEVLVSNLMDLVLIKEINEIFCQNIIL